MEKPKKNTEVYPITTRTRRSGNMSITLPDGFPFNGDLMLYLDTTYICIYNFYTRLNYEILYT